MRTAFKEWAIVVDALARGEQIVILRKGGIHEGKAGFRLDHASFLLFPTRFHQQREGVVESAQTRFDELVTSWPPPDRVRFELVAEVVGSRWVPDRTAALSLRGEHIWRDEVIAAKADWGQSEGLHLIVVRVGRLLKPVELPMLPAYGGCRSWVELAEEVEAGGSEPVVEEKAFRERTSRLLG